MKLIRRLVLAALKFNVSFRAKHIAGKQNVIADQLSRFQFQKARPVARGFAKDKLQFQTSF